MSIENVAKQVLKNQNWQSNDFQIEKSENENKVTIKFSGIDFAEQFSKEARNYLIATLEDFCNVSEHFTDLILTEKKG